MSKPICPNEDPLFFTSFKDLLQTTCPCHDNWCVSTTTIGDETEWKKGEIKNSSEAKKPNLNKKKMFVKWMEDERVYNSMMDWRISKL